MATRVYRVEFHATVTLTCDDTVIDRVVNDEDGWAGYLYDFAKGITDPAAIAAEREAGAVEMLARCIGLMGCSLTGLDGWADIDNNMATTSEEFDIEEYERVS